MGLREGFPRVFQRLLETERDTALGRIDLEDDDFDFLGGGEDLAGMDVLLRPGHFGNVDQAFDARLDFDERTVVGDVRNRAGDLLANRVLGADAVPRIGLKLLHAERDTMGFLVDADDLNLDGLTDRQDLRRMVDAAPCHVGDMQQAVDAAEVDERTVVGDVLDHALDRLTLFEVLDDFGTLLRTAFLKHGTAGNDDVAAALVHLEDFERLRVVHQRGDIAHRADIDLRARQEGHGTVQIDGEAALDLVEDDAFDAFAGFELGFQLDPAFLAACFLARQDGFAKGVFHALDIDLDGVADVQRAVLGLGAEFLQRNTAFDLQADIDNRHIFFDCRNDALDDGTFGGVAVFKRLFKKTCKVFHGGIHI
jgi:hypothetical protein